MLNHTEMRRYKDLCIKFTWGYITMSQDEYSELRELEARLLKHWLSVRVERCLEEQDDFDRVLRESDAHQPILTIRSYHAYLNSL